MKYTAIIILFSAIFISCQAKADSLVRNTAENPARIESSVSPPPVIPPTPKPKAVFGINSKIGIVDVLSDEPSCLRTKNANLAAKTPISIIISLDAPPQKVLTATVERKLEKSCARRASETGDDNPGENYFYSLTLSEDSKNALGEFGFDAGIAVIEPAAQIQVQNKLASIDLDEDGKPEFFRRCTSFEGMLFTVWSGKPLKGKQIWHSFYYLDYDTVSDCKKKDSE